MPADIVNGESGLSARTKINDGFGNSAFVPFPNGITLSGGSDVLDTYELGEHVATITPSGSGTITLDANNTLGYQKIGEQVHVTGLLGVDSVSSPVGRFDISLPFIIADLTDLAGRFSVSIVVAGAVSKAINAFVSLGFEGNTNINVYLGDTTSLVSASAEEIQSGASITVDINYRTT